MGKSADPNTLASDAALREDVHFVTAPDGQRLALTEVSRSNPRGRTDGAAFLLLHGFAQNRKAFTLGPMPEALIDRGARVFLGELRGHGDSRVENQPAWSLGTHLEHDCPTLLEAVQQRTGAAGVHLVGHSMGGLLGCALLERETPLASLTAFATPLLLGAARPLIRLASFLVGPLATIAPRLHRVPMHHFLGVLARPLSRPEAKGPLRLLQRVTRLANPEAAAPEALEKILASADPESPLVMEELARNAVLLRPRLAGVDLVQAVRSSPLPIAAVVGTSDIFAPRAAVAPLESDDQAGPRRIVEIPGGTHVDAIMGHHVPHTIASLWDFLVQGEAPPPVGTSSSR
jgi:pimeloyl-ACP methyl ester carboxylesterase